MCVAAAPLMIASLALTAVSTFAQIQSNRQQAAALKAQGEYESAVARNNQVIQNRMAEDILARGDETATEIQRRGRLAERIQRRDVAQLIGIQRAALAGSGVEVDAGSALDVIADTAGIGEEEAQEIRFETDFEVRNARLNAERAAYERRVGASNFAAEAQLATLRSFAPDTTFATALSGGSTILGRFAVAKKNGIF